MEQAVVRYKKTGDFVLIISLKGFADGDDIGKEFGSEVQRAYSESDGVAMYGGVDRPVVIYDEPSHGHVYVAEGTQWREKDFDKIIDLMKKAGARLHAIVEAAKKEEEEIRI